MIRCMKADYSENLRNRLQCRKRLLTKLKWSNPTGHLVKVVKQPTEVNMTATRKRRKFDQQFKKEAVALVTEQGYSVAKAAQAVDVSENNLRRWKNEFEQEACGERLGYEERQELARLRSRKRIRRIRGHA